jgi:hypothetical protein
MQRPWQVKDRFLELRSRWMTLIGEHLQDERLFWFLCGNEVYTDSFFHKIVLKVLPSKHLTLHKQKLSHKVEKSRRARTVIRILAGRKS